MSIRFNSQTHPHSPHLVSKHQDGNRTPQTSGRHHSSYTHVLYCLWCCTKLSHGLILASGERFAVQLINILDMKSKQWFSCLFVFFLRAFISLVTFIHKCLLKELIVSCPPEEPAITTNRRIHAQLARAALQSLPGHEPLPGMCYWPC